MTKINQNISENIYPIEKKPKLPRIKPSLTISVSSGKGGVGKTLSVIHFAICAAKAGKRVLIFDGDLGLSNVDVVLGIQGKYNIFDVIHENVPLEKVILEGPFGVKVISSGSGITDIQNMTPTQRIMIRKEIMNLNQQFDLIIIDTGAGIGSNVCHLNELAERRVIVTTPEPHALTDAYALIKVLSKENNIKDFSVLINMVSSPQEGRAIYNRLRDVCANFLNISLNFLGSVPFDPALSRQIISQNIGGHNSKHTISGQAFKNIVSDFLKESWDVKKQKNTTLVDFFI